MVVLGGGAVSYERGTPVGGVASREQGPCSRQAISPYMACRIWLVSHSNRRTATAHHESGGSEAGSYLRPIDSCTTQLKAQGLARTCNESKEEEEV